MPLIPTPRTTDTDSGQIFGRGMAFPPRVGLDGRIMWSAGEQNIRESIQIILRTEQNERINLKTFGASLGRFLFEPNIVTTHSQIADNIRKSLTKWEPRILVDNVKVEADPEDAQSAIATIQYSLVATQSAESLIIAIQLSS